MDDEKRNQVPDLGDADGDENSSHSDRSGNDNVADESTGSQEPSADLNISYSPLEPAQEQQSEQPAIGPRRAIPGGANPALAETQAYSEGKITTAEFLRARGSAEAQMPGALEHRDQGLAGRPPFHGSPAPPLRGVISDADLYDIEESHNMHEEPEMHVFAPRMLNIPSEGKRERKERKKRKEK
jgi:hypothetical protein